jgi:hypothetical protein
MGVVERVILPPFHCWLSVLYALVDSLLDFRAFESSLVKGIARISPSSECLSLRGIFLFITHPIKLLCKSLRIDKEQINQYFFFMMIA